MKLILFWLCVTSVTAITNPLWSTYANDNLHPQYFFLYPKQQLRNNFRAVQNSPLFHYSTPSYQSQFQQNVRFPQGLHTAYSQNFPQNLPYPFQPIQNTNLLYIKPNHVSKYNPSMKHTAKKKPSKKTSSKIVKPKKGHSFPVIFVGGDPKNHEFENIEDSLSDHETPQDIPTKPVYPGKGQWAKRGRKHRPHVTKHQFKDIEDNKEPNMGHEIFDEAKEEFEKQAIKFDKDTEHFSQHSDYQDNDYDDTSTEEFVPYKTYAQVRHSHSNDHLPLPHPEDERLKESITHSKTHTIYTEEGYEDTAYDHADREKNADNTEVYPEVKNKKVKSKQAKQKDFKIQPSEDDNIKCESDLHLNSAEGNTQVGNLLSLNQGINSELETTTQPQPELYEDFSKKVVKNLNREKRMVTEDSHHTKLNASVREHNKEKYPYYNLTSIDKNSPLKYSENPDNIPDKKSGVMAFYDLADKIECEEVKKYVDPIPTRVRKSESMDIAAPAPRLGKLGDKIDCFKAKYFGQNPLDNPLFEEEVINAPRTIFVDSSSEKSTKSKMSAEKLSNNNKHETDKISHMIQGYINYEVTEDNLDNDNSMIERIKETVAEDSRKEKVSDIILGRYLREDPMPNMKYFDDSKQIADRADSDGIPKSSAFVLKRRRKPYRANYRRTSVPPVIYTNSYKSPHTTHKPFSEVHYKDEIKPSEQLNVFADVINNIKIATKDAESVNSDAQSIPIETTSIRSRPRRRKIPSRNYKAKTTTTLPLEINKQNMLNSYQSTSSAKPPLKYDNIFSKDLRDYVNPIGESFSKIDAFKDKVELIHDNEIKRNPSLWTPMAKDDNNNISPVETNRINSENFIPSNHRIEDVTSRYEVQGLLPPRIIHTSQRFSIPDLEATSSNFDVIGMRPPPINSSKRRQSHVKKRRVSNPYRLRIVKRSPRRGYAEIRREGKKEDETPQEGEEEYVPHRPRTYHYDVEKGRIIYDKKPASEEVEENYEYVDVVEEVTQNAKPKKGKEKKEERVLKFPEKPPEGPTYIDYVKQLKSDPTYHEIPDPKPTEKTTTLTPSTETPISTAEPEFLSILAKVRSDASYKVIEDEKKTKTKGKIAEVIEEASEIEEEEEVSKDIQNSPGGQVNSFASSQLDIFDISEYLPKVKNYSPSTNVDTSKYKSIERVTITRHNSNSQYTAEESAGDTEGNKNTATTSSQSLSLQTPTSTSSPTAPLPKTEQPQIQEQSRKTTARGRRRSTTTQSPAEEITERSNARRSRGRSRFRSTTSPTEEIREYTRRRRNLPRKYDKNSIPKNHKSHYSSVEPDGSTPKMNKSATSRAITLDILKETNITNRPLKNTSQKTDDVDIFKKFDKSQKHGGNYKYKKVEIKVNQGTNYFPPTAYEIEDSEEIKRLADIVPKPFAFYSDLKLPSRINRLTDANNRDSTEEGIKDELQFFEDAVRANSEATTRKPNFIKDPSKRLYFYAPV